MGTYNLPRNVKGEGRILFIFSSKALIYTAIGAAIGLPFYIIFNAMHMALVGIIIMVILGLIGFCIGTFKMPDTSAFEITKKTGGEESMIKQIHFWIKGISAVLLMASPGVKVFILNTTKNC